ERVPDASGVRAGLLAPFGHRRGGLLALVRRASEWQLDASVDPNFAEYAASAPWYRLGELDGIGGKGVQRFAIGDGRRAVVVMQTHLQTPYPARGHSYEELRRAQIDELLGHARRAGDADAVIVAGDLNVAQED